MTARSCIYNERRVSIGAEPKRDCTAQYSDLTAVCWDGKDFVNYGTESGAPPPGQPAFPFPWCTYSGATEDPCETRDGPAGVAWICAETRAALKP